MQPGLAKPRRLAPVLWVLLGLFVLRVVGQALVAFLGVWFLPPMQAWYSGLLPYTYLLPAQLIGVGEQARVPRLHRRQELDGRKGDQGLADDAQDEQPEQHPQQRCELARRVESGPHDSCATARCATLDA